MVDNFFQENVFYGVRPDMLSQQVAKESIYFAIKSNFLKYSCMTNDAFLCQPNCSINEFIVVKKVQKNLTPDLDKDRKGLNAK